MPYLWLWETSIKTACLLWYVLVWASFLTKWLRTWIVTCNVLTYVGCTTPGFFQRCKLALQEKANAQNILVNNDKMQRHRIWWKFNCIFQQIFFIRESCVFLAVLGNNVIFFTFLFRSVSQELSETILTMVANCSNVMNKARQPPPGVMPKGRPPSASSLDAISPVQVIVPLYWYICICL